MEVLNQIPKTPSLLYNNLTANQKYIAYIHINRVFLIPSDDVSAENTVTVNDSASKSKQKNGKLLCKYHELPYKVHNEFVATQIKWISIRNVAYLLLTTTSGFQLWNKTGSM